MLREDWSGQALVYSNNLLMVRIVNLGLMIIYVKLVMKTKGRYI